MNLGVGHCKYFACCMNGANNLEESDAQPMHLCPIDLHKLHFVLRFDPLERYEALLQWHHQHGFQDEEDWITSRLKSIRSKITKEDMEDSEQRKKKIEKEESSDVEVQDEDEVEDDEEEGEESSQEEN